jgi:predicted acetyltransferase
MGGGYTLEMLKMEIDPTMCMKTQAAVTQCHAKNTASCRKADQLRHH